MLLTSLLKENQILLDIETTSKTQCIERLAQHMVDSGDVVDIDQYVRDVLKREEEGSTGIGFAVAIPHGKSAGVQAPSLAYARLSAPIDWQSIDGEPVKHAFLIAVPLEQSGNEHLRILSNLSRKLIHEEFRAQLNQVKNAEELVELLEQ
ncbi:PTS sugar transporter subunit IIA [Pontibacillus yanchengensis]|uniref:PTS fructose transporter subunit IIA n=1 Tax=Pontibacillus yanchengensis Y32 TaxID=1385514 RepID=A0A0A2TPM0_9BACI|nr:fructose PTS transporter subunit IIA [Pontibacillus yanchengensis]KGP71265.1 PTS fructose transporter subunit IIA [Pontibacillus yanchengensis Y32]